ncbi:MAG: assimilatory sulfite reductase (NADPH) flavoprotein subunit [Pseudomonadota bacterium]
MILSQVPPAVSPLSEEQIQHIDRLVGSLTPVQQAWVSGYLAAAAQAAAPANTAVAPLPSAAATLTVLYGSQTGNAKAVAETLARKAGENALPVTLVDMADYKPNQLKNENHLVIVVSTYGEGEPPESAEKLHAFLASKKAPKLDGAQVAVIGLGDSSYTHFCQTAIDFERRLTALGATVALEHALLDVDYDDAAELWIDSAVTAFEPALKQQTDNNSASIASTAFGGAEPVSIYSRKNPYSAELSVVQKITGRDSTKDVRHIEIALENSGLSYQPGDALGVYFENDHAEVDALIGRAHLNPDAEVASGKRKKRLRQTLVEDVELTQSYPGFVEKYAVATQNTALMALCQDKAALRQYLADRQIFDILREHPAKIGEQALIDCLRPVQARLYSIASSQREVDDDVHLTVALVSDEHEGRERHGGCSGFLCRRAQEGDSVRVFIERNDRFRLPESPETRVIMIGPGTGIAPFRGFLQERDAIGGSGANWLFFGNPHFRQDFLYQVELQNYLKSGLLTRLSVAFSRDQNEKVYVQDRLVEQGEDVYAWLEEGAHLYVCGDANRMAKDVHQALITVLQQHGGYSESEAVAYLTRLRDDKRYQRDVY